MLPSMSNGVHYGVGTTFAAEGYIGSGYDVTAFFFPGPQGWARRKAAPLSGGGRGSQCPGHAPRNSAEMCLATGRV